MKPTLFITGAGGFLGRHVVAKLDFSAYQKVYCLAQKNETISIPEGVTTTVEIITGDLLQVNSYETILKNVDTVFHLAAVTGKANPKVYSQINAYGTMLLLDRCKQAGVKQFLFISSIAVSFKNKQRYFYAFSKEQAEEYVKSSGLKYTILRPTMLMGAGSPVFAGFARLTGLPFIPVFGNGEQELQPVDVVDVAKAILRIESEGRYHGEILEIGGPDTVTIDEFLQKIARARGKSNPRLLHLPIGPIAFILGLLERVIYPLLPITVGQLATFRNNSVAATNTFMRKVNTLLVPLDTMITLSLSPVGAAVPQPVQVELLARECRVFCQYLTRMEPNDYVLQKFTQCHQVVDFTPLDRHDALLLNIARQGRFFTRFTDAYSRFFRSTSVVRKKLAYLMAILEVTPPHFHYYDRADKNTLLVFVMKLGIKGITLAFHLFFSFLFLFPLQVLWGKKGTKKAATQEE